jgi:hypothetical protein
MESKMQSELKEGETRQGCDEYGNRFIEKREGRTIIRQYLNQKITGKYLGEIRQIGRAPDRIDVKVERGQGGKHSALITVISGDISDSESFSIKEGFVNDIKEREKLEGKLLKRFGDLIVQAEASAIVFNIVDKIRELEAEEERLKKKSELAGKEIKDDITNYVIVSSLHGGEYHKVPWDVFLSGGRKGENGGEGENGGSGDKGK